MLEKKVVIGAGQCGMKLAQLYYEKYHESVDELVELSTSIEDSVNANKKSLIQISKEGSGKRFIYGQQTWSENLDIIITKLSHITNKKIIYFTSSGGGSGSSSISFVSDVLLSNNNKIFLSLVLPFKHEQLPFRANTIQTFGNIINENLIDKISILPFDNESLEKKYFTINKYGQNEVRSANINDINNHIVQSTNIIIELISKYHVDTKYSPFTIDEKEHESVVFSKGFIGFDIRKYTDEKTKVTFDFGKLSEAKNIVIAKVAKLNESDYLLDGNAGIFLDHVKSISRRAKNARSIYGIIRTNDLDDGTYIIIANNLNFSDKISKIKDKITDVVKEYHKENKIDPKTITRKDLDVYDV